MKESNIIIFGTGAFYTSHKQMLPEGTQVVAFIDNKAMKHGQYLDGVQIYSPQEGVELEYDYVVLASTTPGVPREMKKQLVLFRVPQDKILYWEEYISMQSHGLLMRYDVEDVVAIEGRKKCLIMVPAINFSGGFLTAQYVAIALKKQGYYVTIASSNANEQALVETNQHGINVWICPALPYVSDVELAWIRSYDIVWINCLPMMYSVDRISKYKPVIWWLHEYSARYEDVFEQYGNDVEDMSFSNVDIYAVSNIAKNNFSRFVPDAKVKVLPLGLPDFAKSVRVSKDKIIVAIIGLLFQSKNQKELIQAINLLPESKKNKLECWLIGKDGSKQYREELEKLAEEGTNIRILGELCLLQW